MCVRIIQRVHSFNLVSLRYEGFYSAPSQIREPPNCRDSHKVDSYTVFLDCKNVTILANTSCQSQKPSGLVCVEVSTFHRLVLFNSDWTISEVYAALPSFTTAARDGPVAVLSESVLLWKTSFTLTFSLLWWLFPLWSSL